MKTGLGAIHLEFRADLPRGAPGRKLRWENIHQREIAVYQVNCLESRDRDVRIGSQRRSPSQSLYELEYTQAASDALNTELR